MAAKKYIQKTYHLDKRIKELIAKVEHQGIPPVFNTEKCAEILDVSVQWLEIARHKKIGPPCVKVNHRMVRYRRDDLLQWLAERTIYHNRKEPRAA
jgi:hypothetical protein